MSEQPVTTFERVLSVPKTSGLTEEARRNRDLIASVYEEATNSGRRVGMTDLLADDVVFYEAESLPYGVTAHGPEATRAGVAAMFAAWSHVRSEFLDYCASGDLVICYLRFTGTARDTGKVYDAYGTEVFRFRDGKIIEWRPFYWDTAAVIEALGK